VCMVMSLIGGSLELKKNIIYWRVEIILWFKMAYCIYNVDKICPEIVKKRRFGRNYRSFHVEKSW
jgi:hypothetical protein